MTKRTWQRRRRTLALGAGLLAVLSGVTLLLPAAVDKVRDAAERSH
jgi:hypothetical protein